MRLWRRKPKLEVQITRHVDKPDHCQVWVGGVLKFSGWSDAADMFEGGKIRANPELGPKGSRRYT